MTAASLPPLGQIGQVALPVQDLDRAVHFYRDILGLPFLFQAPPGLAFFDCAGVRLMLAAPESVGAERAVAPATTLYFRTADLDLRYDLLRGAGVAFAAPPQRIAAMPDHDLFMAFFHDPEGNQLALMSEVPRAVAS